MRANTGASHRRQLHSRAQRDLKEIEEYPYPGVDVFRHFDTLTKFCLVLTPHGGPWTGLRLHFVVELPGFDEQTPWNLEETWPNAPPAISASLHLVHPYIRNGCLQWLKDDVWQRDCYVGTQTLRDLFIRLLGLLSITQFTPEHGTTTIFDTSPIVTYIPDSILIRRQFPEDGNCCRKTAAACVCGPLKTGRQSYNRAEWDASSAPEVFVATYAYDDSVSVYGKTTHTMKIMEEDEPMHRFERPSLAWIQTLEHISTWSCEHCPYGSADFPHLTPITRSHVPLGAPLYMNPASTCCLGILTDDELGEIASYLSTETIHSFGSAYPRFRNIVSDIHILQRRELHCSYLRAPLDECILGIAVTEHRWDGRGLYSEFEWISLDAPHHCYRTPKGAWRHRSWQFLPLAFNRAHFERAHEEIWKRLGLIYTSVYEPNAAVLCQCGTHTIFPTPRYDPPPVRQPFCEVHIVYMMMNDIIVALMGDWDSAYMGTRRWGTYGAPEKPSLAKLFERITEPQFIQDSERCIDKYCQLMHLFTCLCRSDPGLLQEASASIHTFLKDPKARVRTRLPNLGEFLVLLTMVLIVSPQDGSAPVSWATLAGPFLEEVITRNVQWVLQTAPELHIMEEGASDYRLARTFEETKFSLRLVMLQITFMNLFSAMYSSNLTLLDASYGFVDRSLKLTIMSEIKEIYLVKTWPVFFAKVKFDRGRGFGKERFSEMLRKSVRESATRRYHERVKGKEYYILRKKRVTLEGAWKLDVNQAQARLNLQRQIQNTIKK